MKHNVNSDDDNYKFDGMKLIKTLIVFMCYLLYSNVISTILTTFKITSNTLISFIADFLFLVGIVIAYKDNLKKDWDTLKNNYSVSKIIKTVLLWVLIIFVFNIVTSGLTELLFPDMTFDNNTNALFTTFETSLPYFLFKTMIFAVIAEELLLRESIADVISNKYIFIIVSALIYTLLNFIFVGFKSQVIIVDILLYLLPALIFSTAYVKNKNNIIILMLIKFTYNIIPTIIYLIKLYN